MPMRFVYILFNPTHPGKVKIGRTIGPPETRAKDLYTTGVAERFHVVYDELVSDCSLVEKNVHEMFADFRANKGREFFDIPVKAAIKGLAKVAKPYLLPDSTLTIRSEILPKLQTKFPKCMNPDLTSVSVVQLPELNLIELRRRPTKRKHEELVERVDMQFIYGIDSAFPPGTDVRDNVKSFVEDLNLATLVVISEALFSEFGLAEAIKDYEGGNVSEPTEVDPPGDDWAARR